MRRLRRWWELRKLIRDSRMADRELVWHEDTIHTGREKAVCTRCNPRG